MITLATFFRTHKGELDDEYSLLEDGCIVHKFDKSRYPGDSNLQENLSHEQIDIEIKTQLLKAANDVNKEKVRNLLHL
jgi:hypothetical protein